MADGLEIRLPFQKPRFRYLTVLHRQDTNGFVRPSLLHALFPLVRAEILRLLLTNKGQELYVRELARLSFLSLRTVQDELAKLRAARLVLSRTNGYHRFYRANRRHPLYPSLRRIVITAASHPKPKLAVRKRKRR